MRVTHNHSSSDGLIEGAHWDEDHVIEGVVADDDSRLMDARTPTAHTHDYAESDHLHPHTHPENADSVHTHAYADPSHTHPYAADDHSHAGSEAFPVGSVFLSVVSTNPNSLLGYGTWSAIAAGRMLVGRDSGNAAFDTAEETGGSSTHTHAAHSGVINHTHVVSVTDPGHTHVQGVNSATTGGLSGYTPDTSSNTRVNSGYSTSSGTTGITASTANPAGGVTELTHDSPSHLPPYFVVYAWKRTA